MEKGNKVPVSERALIQRINRKLAEDDDVLKTSRGDRARLELGEHYIINIASNYLVKKDVDIESLGRKLGVLQAYEQLQDQHSMLKAISIRDIERSAKRMPDGAAKQEHLRHVADLREAKASHRKLGALIKAKSGRGK